MKRAVFALSLTLAGVLAGCEKASDLPKLEIEAKDLAAAEKGRLEELDRRESPLAKAGEDLRKNFPNTPGIATAGMLLGEARGALDQIRKTVNDTSGAVEDAKGRTTDAMVAVVDRMRETFEHDEIVARADIASVESWMIGVAQSGVPVALPPR